MERFKADELQRLAGERLQLQNQRVLEERKLQGLNEPREGMLNQHKQQLQRQVELRSQSTQADLQLAKVDAK